jgi:type III restriction enzyme
VEVIETRYYESDEAYIRRLLGGRKGRSRSVLVFNDEAHHAYRRGDTADEEELVLDEETAGRNDREATVWIEGLDRINKALGGRAAGIRLCLDFSATPFYIQGSGNEVGKPFPWVVSDFALLDSIESGLVKIPQLPVQDITGAQTPPYFNIWRWVEEQARKEGYAGALTAEAVMRCAVQSITQLAAEWEKTFESWQAHHRAGLRQSPAPPVGAS